MKNVNYVNKAKAYLNARWKRNFGLTILAPVLVGGAILGIFYGSGFGHAAYLMLHPKVPNNLPFVAVTLLSVIGLVALVTFAFWTYQSAQNLKTFKNSLNDTQENNNETIFSLSFRVLSDRDYLAALFKVCEDSASAAAERKFVKFIEKFKALSDKLIENIGINWGRGVSMVETSQNQTETLTIVSVGQQAQYYDKLKKQFPKCHKVVTNTEDQITLKIEDKALKAPAVFQDLCAIRFEQQQDRVLESMKDSGLT